MCARFPGFLFANSCFTLFKVVLGGATTSFEEDKADFDLDLEDFPGKLVLREEEVDFSSESLWADSGFGALRKCFFFGPDA